MTPRLKVAKYIDDHRVWLEFDDGTKGEVNFLPELFGEIFEPLRAPDVFRQFSFHPELKTLESHP